MPARDSQEDLPLARPPTRRADVFTPEALHVVNAKVSHSRTSNRTRGTRRPTALQERVCMFLRRRFHLYWPLLVLSTACGAADSTDTSDEAVDDSAALTESAAAKKIVDAVRARVARSGSEDSPLSADSSVQLQAAGASLRADLAGGAKVALPRDAREPFRLNAAESPLWVQARLRGARAAQAELADGLVVYENGAPGGGALIHRVSSEGTEDWLSLDRHPEGDRVVYEVELSNDVRGLRLVENTLEFLDAAATPRLRVEAPYLIDAQGQRRDAQLEVEGCQVDRSAAAPWGRPVTPPGAARCEVVVSWDESGVSYPVMLDPSWSTTAQMSVARARHTAVTLNTTRVLVTGGQQGTTTHSSAELFDPSTQTWAATGSMSVARTRHTATLRTSNGTVVVVGGWNQSSTHRSAESYNPSTGTWSSLPQPLAARRDHTATLLGNGEILVAGGTGSSALASSETLSTGNAWTQAGNLLATQTGHAATLYAPDRVLLTGSNAPTSQRYDAATRTWTATSGTATNTRPTSLARQWHSSTLLGDGSVLLAGGTNATRTSERYDPATDSFSYAGYLNYEHSEHTAIRLSSNRVLIVGGPATNARSATELYNPTWGTWAPQYPVTPQSTRRFHTAVMVGSKVLITGGIIPGTSTTLASSEIYDPAGSGVSISEYELPRHRDPEVRPDVDIELWASLHRPTTLTAGKRYPLLVFLHGAYGTCRQDGTIFTNNDYANTGSCPAGYTRISNHRGYDYLAEELAARGYFVVSINANYGINSDTQAPPNDLGQVGPRGRLILRHLEKLSRWDRGLEPTPTSLAISLQNRIDFGQVGLFGHSRGGEAARIAYNEYRAAGSPWPSRIDTPNAALNIRGIFEIGPTDRRDPKSDAPGTRWVVLLPGCDGDNGTDGINPFNRMLASAESPSAFKASFQVYGTNHNNYNTQWWTGDPSFAGCVNHEPIYINNPSGSPRQRQTGLHSVLAFFTANVGATVDAAANRVFDPAYGLNLGYRVHRGYQPGASVTNNKPLDDMPPPPGFVSHSTGPGVTLSYHPLSDTQRAADLVLSTPGTATYFQSNFAQVHDLNAYQNIDFRIDRINADPSEPIAPGNVSVELVNADGSRSVAVALAPHVDLAPAPKLAAILQTARVPLSKFSGANRSAIAGIRFLISDPAVRGLSIANIRATRTTTP